jgi:hypothetical protein
MAGLNFKCTGCGGTRIEEVLEGVTKYSEISSVVPADDGTLAIEYGNTNDDGGCFDRFQCMECGRTVPYCEMAALAARQGGT